MITAAHCQNPRIERKRIAEVVLGEWDISKDPDCEPDCAYSPFKKAQRFEITTADVIVHEDWDLNKVAENGNDIERKT